MIWIFSVSIIISILDFILSYIYNNFRNKYEDKAKIIDKNLEIKKIQEKEDNEFKLFDDKELNDSISFILFSFVPGLNILMLTILCHNIKFLIKK